MTLHTVLVEIEDTALAALKAAGHIIEGVVVSIGQQLVAKVKATDLGTTAMNIISLLESHTGSGEEKMASLLGLVTPAITKLEASGGLSGLETSVENFAREFAQSSYNDFVAVVPKVEAAVTEAAAPLALEVQHELQPA